MSAIDFILNIVALLLWIGWNDMGAKESVSMQSHPLMFTLKKTESNRQMRWPILAWLVGLLVGRALFYWYIGSTMGWTGRLDFGAITVPFRSDRLGLMLLFSLLSFAIVLAAWYACLLLLSTINKRGLDSDTTQRFIRRALGKVELLPGAIKLLIPSVAGVLLWAVCGKFLGWIGLLPAAKSSAQYWQQTAVMGAGFYLAWKLVLVGVMLLYLLNSYVYLGNQTFWNWVGITARRMLWPLHWLRFGKLDLSPVGGIALVLYLGYLAEYGLMWLFQRAPFL